MKKIALMIVVFLSITGTYAQNSAVTSARNYLRESDYDNAIKYIEQALADISTKDKAKTHYAKGDIYMQMYLDSAYHSNPPSLKENAYKVGTNAFLKVVSIDPDYERQALDPKFLLSAFVYYNEGVAKYRTSNYSESYDLFKSVVDIHDLEGGKRFKNKGFDTVAANAQEMMGYSALYLKKYDDALAAFKPLKNNPIVKTPALFISLSDVYGNLNKKDDQLAVLQEGRKAFPADANLRNEEINYYIANDKINDLVTKLQEAIAQEPNNAELQHSLANIYNNMANPKTGSKPANAKELIAKAEEGYQKAIALKPNDAEYNFNYSVLYYMQAYDVVMAMNALGSTPAEQKKYDVLNKEKEDLLNKALPYAEKAYSILEPREKELSGKEKDIYKSTMTELFELYAKLNKADKATEMKKKKDAYN